MAFVSTLAGPADVFTPGRTAGLAAVAFTLAGLATSFSPTLAWAVLAGAVLVWAGTRMAWIHVQTILLAALLFVPDIASGRSFGLLTPWSDGLTWSNFVVPALAIPLLAGAWWAGRPLWPRRWPGLARGLLALLGWLLLTLAAARWGRGAAITAMGTLTLLAHAGKLLLFVLLGVALSTGTQVWRRRGGRLLLAGAAVNAVVGLMQAAGWLASLSPLARGVHARATGLFYDANLYAVISGWALLWLLCQPIPRGWRGIAGTALALALAGSLVSAGSRAGYAACGAGCVLLWCTRHRRAVARAAGLLLVLALLFPARSWQRVRSAALTVASLVQIAPGSAPVRDASTAQRLGTMHEALRQIGQHPWLGLGFGRALYLGVPAAGAGPVAPARLFRGAQNMFLTVWASGGAVAVALLLLAVAAPLRLLDRARRQGSAPWLAGYAGVLVSCLTQEALWNARLLALVIVLTTAAALPWGGGR